MNASLQSLIRLKGVGKDFLTDEVETRGQPGTQPRINHSECLFTVGSSGRGNATSPSNPSLLDLSTEGRFSLYGEAVALPGLAERVRMRDREAGFFFLEFEFTRHLAAFKRAFPVATRSSNDRRETSDQTL